MLSFGGVDLISTALRLIVISSQQDVWPVEFSLALTLSPMSAELQRVN